MVVSLVFLEDDDTPLWVLEHPDVLAERIDRADQDALMRVRIVTAYFDDEDEYCPKGVAEYTSYLRPRYVVQVMPLGSGRRKQLDDLVAETA